MEKVEQAPALATEERFLVSVVMCAYNTRAYIEEAVTSILNQTYKNLELVICDDGSTDGTRQWLQTLTDTRVRLFLHEKNMGYVANKNFAIQQARGTFITQNDSDDTSAATRLVEQMAVVANQPDAKIIGCGYQMIDQYGQAYHKPATSVDAVFTTYSATTGYPFWFPPLLVHRDVYAEVGFFTDYFAGIGVDLYWTIKANERFPIYYISSVLYKYRNNPESISNVLNNERKLIVSELLRRIIQQRKQTGSDWLEQHDEVALKELEQRIVRNKKFMSVQYRLWAAKAIDKANWSQAHRLLLRSLKANPLNALWYRTFLYYLRKRFA